MTTHDLRHPFWISLILFVAAGVGANGAESPAAAGQRHFDVRTFGAVGDGKTLDTAAINKAIEAAHAAGGGTVLFTAGTYVSGSIHLQSDIALYLDAGATIEATTNAAAYDPPEPNEWGDKYQYQDFGHSHWHNSLIWGEGVANVSILGPGRIHGKGLTRSLSRDNVPEGVGNKAIGLKNCHNVIIRDVSILHGGHFAILATGVDNLTIDNLKIDTNRDGMDIDCCRNVRISNCSVNSPWDDAICLKSSYGLGYARATENVTINNCFVTAGYLEGSLLDGTFQRAPSNYGNRTGRIKCGTESNGGFKNITIANCIFEDCQGLTLEIVDGGSMEDVTVSNIAMRDIIRTPLFIRLGNRARGPTNTVVGVIRRVNISNIVLNRAYWAQGSIVSGIPDHPIEDVRISNVHLVQDGGGTKENAAIVPPERENAYPETSMFGTMPSFGFFVRHVKGITVNDVTVRFIKEDLRPAVVLQDVTDATFNDVKAPTASGVPTFVLKQVRGFAAHNCNGLPDTRRETVDQDSL